ncbi:glycosyl hydrolase family 8 [Pedobacter sp. UBA5917]|jgi:endo-1,4-beta-D-glucanase Y|uniref:glycosyl hydrolase family 8 n=1 Tax=Pedobacter sp. UBA5917 TaxID=1947061 RepID=UPI0025D72AE2|nr:glycosyl hydrolase family 8 [Pedobacter sp. UBA5917]
MNKLLLFLITAMVLPGISKAQQKGAVKTSYTAGTIKPNHKSAEQLNADLGMVYDRWKKNYLTEDIGVKGQYYIKSQRTGTVTVSEAHGYGMISLAYLAWYDKDAKLYFDGMARFFKAHPSNGNKHLMCWQEGIRDGKVISVGGSCATDGDMDIAYAFLLADKIWGSTGEINYRAEALSVIDALMQSIVHRKFKTLKMGDWAGNEGSRVSDGSRPSDFMLQQIKAYQKATGNKTWNAVVDSTYAITQHIFASYSPATGLMPDFVERKDGRFIPAIGELLEGDTDGAYAYNSARFPWRMATDYLSTGDKRGLAQLTALNTWIQKASSGETNQIYTGYRLDGSVLPGRNNTDLAFQSPFMVSAMINKDNQLWLNKLWDNGVKRSGSYFGDSITLLCMIVASGNWWTPE